MKKSWSGKKAVYTFWATGAIRGSPAGMKPLTTTNSTEELLRLAWIITAAL
jgi:hypothetical protein